MTRRFRVVIPYDEPTYQVRRPGPAGGAPYRAEYVVTAADERAAMAEALLQFHADASSSGVGWVREPRHEAIEVHAQ